MAPSSAAAGRISRHPYLLVVAFGASASSEIRLQICLNMAPATMPPRTPKTHSKRSIEDFRQLPASRRFPRFYTRRLAVETRRDAKSSSRRNDLMQLLGKRAPESSLELDRTFPSWRGRRECHRRYAPLRALSVSSIASMDGEPLPRRYGAESLAATSVTIKASSARRFGPASAGPMRAGTVPSIGRLPLPMSS
jgi:hypothetical protein